VKVKVPGEIAGEWRGGNTEGMKSIREKSERSNCKRTEYEKSCRGYLRERPIGG